MSAPVAGGASSAVASAKEDDAGQTQTQPARLTAADKGALRNRPLLRRSCTNRSPRRYSIWLPAAPPPQPSDIQNSESPNEPPTLTTDREDYPPFSYVYFHGTGFQPGEKVNMIVVELSPDPGSFEPWDVEADENGEFDTSWYLFSEHFRGATLQATATGQSSGLTASATFTDAVVLELDEDAASHHPTRCLCVGRDRYSLVTGAADNQVLLR